jgi:hypothetical protein
MAAVMEDMVREVAPDLQFAVAPRAAHRVPEENPSFLVDVIARLVG